MIMHFPLIYILYLVRDIRDFFHTIKKNLEPWENLSLSTLGRIPCNSAGLSPLYLFELFAWGVSSILRHPFNNLVEAT